jgi:valyl-tRNA synthetase
VAAEVLGQVRRAKTTAKRSMRSPVAAVAVADTPERIAALRLAEDDLRDAGGIATVDTTPAAEFAVEVELAHED